MILAAISIQAITNTGIFTQANNAQRESEIANIKEQIVLDIYEKQLEPPVGSITEDQLETILGKYGTIIYEEDGVTIKGITTAKGYEILLKDIYRGETVAESVPDGATVTPVNDITTWLKTAEISKQYSYTTIEQVIEDSTCTQSLMNNENAMKYLARSTEFANAICANEAAMTYLGQSAYVDNTVLNSDSWKQSIKASEYWSLVYASKVVTVYGAVDETITIDGYYGSFTTGTNGSCSHVVPIDTITLTGSVSGQSFTRTVTSETTEVYVMTEGALYWYGTLNHSSIVNCRKYTHKQASAYAYMSGIYTNMKIDLSKYKKVCVDYECVSVDSNSITNTSIAIWDGDYNISNIPSMTVDETAGIIGERLPSGYTHKELNISDISGSYYVNILESNPSSIDSYAKCYCENKASYLYLNGYNNTYILKIYKVWVE